MATADLVVVNDAASRFRDQSAAWEDGLPGDRQTGWILTKMASPIGQGPLWNHLLRQCADRTVLLMTANDLRRTEVHISRELSWERTAQDLLWELTNNSQVRDLSRCAHVVVSFGTCGAVWLSSAQTGDSAERPLRCRLVFDPAHFEASWGQEYPGGMIGETTCLAAGLARELLLQPDNPAIERGIQAGVAAMRRLHKDGYGAQGAHAPISPPAFPLEAVARELAQDAIPLSAADVPDPVRLLRSGVPAGRSAARPAPWAILDDLCVSGEQKGGADVRALDALAHQIVLTGWEKPLASVPLGQFGKFVTADRQEIEGYRSLRALIAEYCSKPQPRPLNIAVFGPPGAGKSFGVSQVARSVMGADVQSPVFNLSQLSDPGDLVDALHQVRDIALSGRIPLVFWDEFDASLAETELGWLRYFLAPMQDGTFQDGQLTYHVGQAIFVFAGGTSSRMDLFSARVSGPQYRSAKGPDFVSRLRGYVNVLGPNRDNEEDPDRDPHYLIRRAMLLRSMLQRSAPHLFEQPGGRGRVRIDPGVLRAFLRISRYAHGARSMESVISMSLLAGRPRYERSCLPFRAQLDLHVNGLEFLALVQQPDLQGDLLEMLAEGVHETYRRLHQGQPDANPAALAPYRDLPSHYQEMNRAGVYDIARKVARAGCVLVPARDGEPLAAFPEDELERLAEEEHLRWLLAKASAGYRYAPGPVDDTTRTHPCMLTWSVLGPEELAALPTVLHGVLGPEALSDAEKEKDREMVRAVPDIVARAGFTLARLQGS